MKEIMKPDHFIELYLQLLTASCAKKILFMHCNKNVTKSQVFKQSLAIMWLNLFCGDHALIQHVMITL